MVATDPDGKKGQDVSDAPFSIYNCATPTLLSLFHADGFAGGVELRWRFGNPAAVTAVAVERATSSRGPWSPVTAALSTEGGETVAQDRTAAAGTSYWYRLNVTLSSGQAVVYGPISASAGQAVASFGLGRVGPTPSAGHAIRVEYAVARTAYARITVVDLQGRAVATLVDGTAQPGRYSAAWSPGGDVQTGIYFVTYQVAGNSYTRRIVVTE